MRIFIYVGRVALFLNLLAERDAQKEAKCLVDTIIKLTKKSGASSSSAGAGSSSARSDLSDRKTLVRKAARGIAELAKTEENVDEVVQSGAVQVYSFLFLSLEKKKRGRGGGRGGRVACVRASE